MKRTKLSAGVLALVCCASLFAASKKDPVLMTVNGKDVTLSEFEYMYNKNNQQQLSKQPLDKYVDMFTVYKLKVADAQAAGIDTTKAFIKEFNGYRNELVAPFMTDSAAIEAAAKELYNRYKYNVKASHIMLPLEEIKERNAAVTARLDSIRTCIINGESFEDLAEKYSIDRSVKVNKGSMGYVKPGRFPIEFEDACYNTPVGEISPVFSTNFGQHIVKVYDIKEDDGEVLVEHILKLFPQKNTVTAEEKAVVEKQMQEIYDQLKGGADFEELAQKVSEDPGSRAKGGNVGWFSRGKMVPEFEEVAYKLQNGEISEPFATVYGIHIIKKLDSRKMRSYADMHQEMFEKVQAGATGKNVGFDSKLAQLKDKYKYMRIVATEKALYSEVSSPNELDSAFIAKHTNDQTPLFTIAGINHPVAEIINGLKNRGKMRDEVAVKIINQVIEQLATDILFETERTDIVNRNEEYRNLVNEYRDGMLLFEISNNRVWNKGITDTEGLEKFYNEHKSDYKWDSSKYKGFLISAKNDSIAKLVKAQLKDIGEDSLARTLRKEFKSDVKIEKVLVAKGENAMVDSEVFGGEKVKSDGKYKEYFVAKGKVILQPEDVNDVKGLVVSDYQNYLEQLWIKELRAKYPVKINEKVLKKIKE